MSKDFRLKALHVVNTAMKALKPLKNRAYRNNNRDELIELKERGEYLGMVKTLSILALTDEGVLTRHADVVQQNNAYGFSLLTEYSGGEYSFHSISSMAIDESGDTVYEEYEPRNDSSPAMPVGVDVWVNYLIKHLPEASQEIVQCFGPFVCVDTADESPKWRDIELLQKHNIQVWDWRLLRSISTTKGECYLYELEFEYRGLKLCRATSWMGDGHDWWVILDTSRHLSLVQITRGEMDEVEGIYKFN